MNDLHSTTQTLKSLVFFHICFHEASNFFKWFYAIVLQAFQQSFYTGRFLLISSLIVVPDHFQRNVVVFSIVKPFITDLPEHTKQI